MKKTDQKLTIVTGACGGGSHPGGMGGGALGSTIWTETDEGFVGRPLTKEEVEAHYKALKGEPDSD